MDGGIDLFKFDSRWFHRQSFDKLFPNMASVFPINAGTYTLLLAEQAMDNQVTVDRPTVEDDNNSYYGDEDQDCVLDELGQGSFDGEDQAMEEDAMDEDTLIDVSNKENFITQVAQTGENVSYSHIMDKCSEVARTCQNDQPKMHTLLANLHCMKERVKDGLEIFAQFETGRY